MSTRIIVVGDSLDELRTELLRAAIEADKNRNVTPLGKALKEKAIHSILFDSVSNNRYSGKADRSERIAQIFSDCRYAEKVAEKEKEDSKPYFTTKNYRSLDRQHPDVQLFISQMIAITGIEKKQLKSMLWDFNPYVKYNINPGPKMISLTNRSLKSFFTHVAEAIEEQQTVESYAKLDELLNKVSSTKK